jgi:hypothetical protein
MGVRLVVANQAAELAAVETATEDDFMFFRDSVHLALESGKFASRFPMLFKTFLSDWLVEDIASLERELKEIHAAFRALPPEPPDASWRQKLRHSGRTPETLAEVYVDRNGAPLLEGLIALVQIARENKLPIQWSDGLQPVGGCPAAEAEPKAESAELPGGPDEPLLSAVEAGDLEAARAALAAGASANARVDVRDEWACSSSTPALYTACYRGDTAMVELLLSHGADPNGVFKRRGIVDFETQPCLMAAMPRLDIVSMLLRAGADPNLPGTWGEDRTTETSPLRRADGNPMLTDLLWSFGAR